MERLRSVDGEAQVKVHLASVLRNPNGSETMEIKKKKKVCSLWCFRMQGGNLNRTLV